MTSPIRIALFGTGRIGQVHAESIAASPEAELVWICDPMTEVAQGVASRLGGRVTGDPAEVFAAGDVDAIVVGSPTATHVDLIDRAIDAGFHVLCEKPIDLDLERVDALRAKAAAASVVIALGFNRRFDANFESIRERVGAGEIGRLEQLSIISRDPAPAPRAYIAVSGGIFRDMTIHDFDMARFFVPDIVEVTAVGQNAFSDDIRAEGDFDGVSVTMRGAGGELVTILNSRHSSFGYDQRLEAFGSTGMLSASNVAPTTVRAFSASGVEGMSGPYQEFFLERYAAAYRRELEVFIEAARGGERRNPGYEDGRAALVLADAAARSARSGATVSVVGLL